MDTAYDISYYFDENLHEVANAPDDMRAAVDDLLAEISDSTNSLRLFGMVGSLARILHDFELARDALNRAIELAQRQDNQRALFVNQMRLAHVYQWEKDFQTSNLMFSALIAEAEGASHLADYLDFVYQHAGKNAFDQQNYKQAVVYFKKALSLRKKKLKHDLIESSQFALEAAQSRLA